VQANLHGSQKLRAGLQLRRLVRRAADEQAACALPLSLRRSRAAAAAAAVHPFLPQLLAPRGHGPRHLRRGIAVRQPHVTLSAVGTPVFSTIFSTQRRKKAASRNASDIGWGFS
jgi:hypothetical protein